MALAVPALAVALALVPFQLAITRQPSILPASLVPLVLLVCLGAVEVVRRSTAVVLVAARTGAPARVGAARWRVSSASRQCDLAAPGHTRPRAPGCAGPALRSTGSTH